MTCYYVGTYVLILKFKFHLNAYELDVVMRCFNTKVQYS